MKSARKKLDVLPGLTFSLVLGSSRPRNDIKTFDIKDVVDTRKNHVGISIFTLCHKMPMTQ